jgi:hypothetical protein
MWFFSTHRCINHTQLPFFYLPTSHHPFQFLLITLLLSGWFSFLLFFSFNIKERTCGICLLCLAYYTSHDIFQLHPLCSKWQGFIHWVCVYTCVCAYLFNSDRHLVWFHILGAMNSATMNVGMQISLWYAYFIFFGQILKSGIAESHGSCIFSFLVETP